MAVKYCFWSETEHLLALLLSGLAVQSSFFEGWEATPLNGMG